MEQWHAIRNISLRLIPLKMRCHFQYNGNNNFYFEFDAEIHSHNEKITKSKLIEF